jgi:serine protease
MKNRSASWMLVAVCCTSLGFPLFANAGGADLSSPPGNQEVGGIIVKFRGDQKGAALNGRVLALQDRATRRGSVLKYFRAGSLGMHVLKFDRKTDLREAEILAREIEANDPTVEYAEPDRVAHPAFVPNDTRYNEQWHYFHSLGGINLQAAWDLSTGSGVRVAVLDTGYRPHADLNANIVGGYDFITDPARANDLGGRDSSALDPGDWTVAGQCSPGSSPTNSSWHGTHVAGTIAAVTNNGTGVAGVAFNSRVVPVRVLGRCGGDVSDIADAIVWAAGGAVPGVPANPNPARVLNLSLAGGGGCGPTYQNAIDTARALNSVIVIAAGNDNADAANTAPANCVGVITVAATNLAGSKAGYSNFGATVEIAAPGGEVSPNQNQGVLSTLNTGALIPGSDSYQFYQGTSMATPHVAGVAALMLALNPSFTPDQVLQVLQATARSFPGTCSQCGSGIVDAAGAVAPYVDTLSFTVGNCGNASVGMRGFSPAFPGLNCPVAIGAVSPALLTGGRQVTMARDLLAVVSSTFQFSVAGFSSNPGASWLIGISVNGATVQFTNFTYSAGTATWSKVNSGIPAPNGATVPLRVIHR